MPDSKNQHSVSGLPVVQPELRTNGHHTNGHADPDEAVHESAPASAPDSPPPIPPQYQRLPDFSDAPSPAETTVEEPAGRSRSLRMQWRFWRTLVFAGFLFARLVFWQVFIRKYFPDWVDRTNMRRWRKYARQYRRFAIALGGVYIKLGQFISTRVDILPEEIIKELESLQDEVPSIKFNRIRSVIESELGSVDARYAYISSVPVAAASLGQVHRARLHGIDGADGEKVIIKVQRPGIRAICYTDLAAMRVVARVAMRWSFISNRCDAGGLVDEFGKVLLEELSYKHEAHNAARFAEMFKHDMGVYIPAVYYEHSTDHVLTMEDVTSIKITDYAAIEAAGISRKAVAKRLMDTYLPQVFDHYFFHADPHPGNLFVYPLPVEDENVDFGPQGRPFYLIFVDFGMTGTLVRQIADGIVSTMFAVLARDHKRLVRSYVDLGFVLPGADIARIEEATKAAFDQVWGLSMADMRDIDYKQVADLAHEFNDLIFAMPFYIPQDFIYLGRTISILSGMCTSLDPEYNPWHELQPYTERLIARGFGVDMPPDAGRLALGAPILQSLFSGSGTQALRAIGQEVVRRTITPITRADDVLQRLDEGEIHVIAELSAVHRQQLKRLERETRRTSRAVFFGSVLVASTVLYTSGETTLAAIGAAVCALTLLFGSLRD